MGAARRNTRAGRGGQVAAKGAPKAVGAQPPETHHQEQTASDGCVAACMCMVERWLGRETSEEDARARLRELPRAGLRTAALVTGWRGEFMNWDSPLEREILLGHLARGFWLIVDVYPGHLTMLAERLVPAPVSRHGALMRRSPEDTHRREDLTSRVPQYPHHAIVLVESAEGAIRYLDPWFPVRGQPFAMSREDFSTMWTGQVIIPETTRKRV